MKEGINWNGPKNPPPPFDLLIEGEGIKVGAVIKGGVNPGTIIL